MSYAVLRTGGKQVRVEPGDVIRIEKIAGEPGVEVDLTDVLLTSGDGGLKVGTPVVEGASVKARVLEQAKSRKIIVFKKKRRKGYRRKKGHRQELTTLRVLEINT